MELVEIGGRRFKVIDFERRTVLNDDYLRKLLRLTGADAVMPMDGEGDDAYLVRLHVCLTDSLKTPDLVAGMLLDEDKTELDFSLEMAKETAKHIARCNSPEDREQVKQLAMKVTLDFFREGLSWLRRFHSFGGEMENASALARTPAAPA